MNKFQYSIIYAVIRPDTSEKISIGMLIVDDSNISVHYSDNKLNALKYLFPSSSNDFINKAIRSLSTNNNIKSKKDIDYLSRYSNNLITFSPLQPIDLEPSLLNKKRLFHRYVESLVEGQQ